MTDYDSMSVHELVLEAAKDGMQGFLHDANPELCELPEIESALRCAVIRESSVGEIEVKVRESGDELSRPNDPDRIVTVSEQFICQTWIPEGKYRLVKEEGV